MKGLRAVLNLLRSERVQDIADLVLETSFLAFVFLIFFSDRAGNAALILVALSWIIRRLACSPFLPQVPLRLPLLLFLISLLLSSFFAEDLSHSFRDFFSKAPKILVVFFGSLEYLRDRDRYRKLFWVSTWVILLIGADGLVQYLRGYDLIREAGLWKGRVRAHLGSPAFFEYVLPFLPFSLCLWGEGGNGWKRAFLGVAAVAFVASALLSQTRSVWIALSLVILFLAAFSRHRIPLLISIALMILALGMLPMARGRASLFSVRDLISEQKHQRLLAWQISYRMFLSRPILGKGVDFFDNYKRNAQRQRPYLSPSLLEEIARGGKGIVFPIYHPHSIYLELLAGQGLVGMATFVFVLTILLLSLWKKRRGPPLPLLATSASLLSFLVCGAVGTSFYDFRSFAMFWLLAGMVMSLEGKE